MYHTHITPILMSKLRHFLKIPTWSFLWWCRSSPWAGRGGRSVCSARSSSEWCSRSSSSWRSANSEFSHSWLFHIWWMRDSLDSDIFGMRFWPITTVEVLVDVPRNLQRSWTGYTEGKEYSCSWARLKGPRICSRKFDISSISCI